MNERKNCIPSSFFLMNVNGRWEGWWEVSEMKVQSTIESVFMRGRLSLFSLPFYVRHCFKGWQSWQPQMLEYVDMTGKCRKDCICRSVRRHDAASDQPETVYKPLPLIHEETTMADDDGCKLKLWQDIRGWMSQVMTRWVDKGVNHGTKRVSKASHWQDMMNRDERGK